MRTSATQISRCTPLNHLRPYWSEDAVSQEGKTSQGKPANGAGSGSKRGSRVASTLRESGKQPPLALYETGAKWPQPKLKSQINAFVKCLIKTLKDNMNNLNVAIIVRTKNRPKQLGEALASINNAPHPESGSRRCQ